ncbi:winged helix-turn-helix domain-containing protein [uncultured Alsobacter sp.]|uniref:winged helix-turn-helix domain-containing protein n=1 Tax=uncultured Alsobacter sp. TaxID=1748258 RepID=UPI0025FB59FE|nr:winged helix-turn-helix domain-containing protein [uncultured Alsobacter sp.]
MGAALSDTDASATDADGTDAPGPVFAATQTLTPLQARRIALAAQGLARPRRGAAEAPDFLRLTQRLGLLQIDSVNVLARAHYMPAFSRLGAYDRTLLDTAAYGGRRRKLFEYWGHEASLIRVEHQPLLRWRMERARAGQGTYTGLARFGRERAAYIDTVLEEVRRRGALSARDFGHEARGTGSWWGWSDAKRALEWLFWAGLLTTATRRDGFDRVYDLPERVLPRAVVDTPTPDPAEARRGLLRVAARALGIGTVKDLRDYFRLGPADAAPHIAELVEEGTLRPVAVKGWKQPAFLHAGAVRPRPEGQALLSPFDPVVWERDRVERLFGLRYRIEIYTPAHKRVHGYYVLPFLLRDRLVARLDLKADRQRGRLVVASAHLEPGADEAEVTTALAEELALLSTWLGLGDVEVHAKGDLADPLRRRLG